MLLEREVQSPVPYFKEEMLYLATDHGVHVQMENGTVLDRQIIVQEEPVRTLLATHERLDTSILRVRDPHVTLVGDDRERKLPEHLVVRLRPRIQMDKDGGERVPRQDVVLERLKALTGHLQSFRGGRSVAERTDADADAMGKRPRQWWHNDVLFAAILLVLKENDLTVGHRAKTGSTTAFLFYLYTRYATFLTRTTLSRIKSILSCSFERFVLPGLQKNLEDIKKLFPFK